MENHQVVLLLGGNIGDSKSYIRKALFFIQQKMGKITRQSSFYQSPSWGFHSSDFINLGLLVETTLNEMECLDITQSIEKDLGRGEKSAIGGYTDRTMDVDIIFYDDVILESEKLMLPHPRMQVRQFVLQPLAEIIPEFQHPISRKSILELAVNCPDSSPITKLDEQV